MSFARHLDALPIASLLARSLNSSPTAVRVVINKLDRSPAVPIQVPCTVHDFLVEQNLPPRSLVVEYNGEALAPSEFATCELNPGDRLELVKFVAGS
jgi:sulfur carrier protein